MQPELITLYMEANSNIVIAGLEKLVEKDLQKHKDILKSQQAALQAFRQARKYEINTKRRI